MKIASIHVSHFLGLAAVDVRTRASIQLFAGPNGAGKSSLRDAVALALTADLGRVGLKKEAPALIRDGADLAVCEVTTDEGDQWQVTINRSGTIHDSQKGRLPDPVLPSILDAQSFARLTPTERRAFLFELMNVKTEPAAIRAMLGKRDLDAAKVERMMPLLRSGFDAAAKEAKAQATQAKGSWRAVTGETYGSEKAKTWRATVPPYDASAAAAVATEIKHADAALESWQQQIGTLQAEEQRRAAIRGKLPALQEQALRIERITAKMEVDQKALQEATQALEAGKAAAGVAPRVGLLHELAWAVDNLIFFGEQLDEKDPTDARVLAALSAYEAEHGKVQRGDDQAGDVDAQARLPELTRQHALMLSALDHDRRDLAAAQKAKAEADAITAELAEVFDAAALAAAREQVDAIKAKRAAAVKRGDELRSIKALVDGAEAKTKQAAQHHADVAAWDALGDALGPDGIPAELLNAALGPLNERLAQSAADTGWPEVRISADMHVAAAGREYRLLSESERWRCDAMIAEAISTLSQARLLVLDRFDVLDLPGRSELLGWLDTLADTGEIDTALIFGTLKALPSLPNTMQAHWIDGGVCEQLKEAA